MIDRNDHNVALLGERASFVAGKVVTRSGREAASVEPYEHGAFLAVVEPLGPYIEHKAVVLVHRLHHKLETEIIVALRISLEVEGLTLRSFGAVDTAFEHSVVRGRLLRRHKSLGAGIWYALECVDIAVAITLDFTIDSIRCRGLVGHERTDRAGTGTHNGGGAECDC